MRNLPMTISAIMVMSIVLYIAAVKELGWKLAIGVFLASFGMTIAVVLLIAIVVVLFRGA